MGEVEILPDWDELRWAANAMPLREQLELYVKYLNDFENSEAAIDKSKPEELELIEDWEFGAKCQAKINGIKRLIENRIIDTANNYQGIANALKEYIRGASDDDLQTIITTKKLASGAERKEWIGSKADACRFIAKLNMPLAKFNKCFYFEDKKPLAANRRVASSYKEEDGQCAIINILGEFIP